MEKVEKHVQFTCPEINILWLIERDGEREGGEKN